MLEKEVERFGEKRLDDWMGRFCAKIENIEGETRVIETEQTKQKNSQTDSGECITNKEK